uniref:Uncharacterized protein n=1 Tax=Strigamia maritima TaxID=126957 RepID=T1IKC4_STRMM
MYQGLNQVSLQGTDFHETDFDEKFVLSHLCFPITQELYSSLFKIKMYSKFILNYAPLNTNKQSPVNQLMKIGVTLCRNYLYSDSMSRCNRIAIPNSDASRCVKKNTLFKSLSEWDECVENKAAINGRKK